MNMNPLPAAPLHLFDCVVQQDVKRDGRMRRETVQPSGGAGVYCVKKNVLRVMVPTLVIDEPQPAGTAAPAVRISEYPPECDRTIGARKYSSHQDNMAMATKLHLFEPIADGRAILSTAAFYIRHTKDAAIEIVDGQHYWVLTINIMNRAAGTRPEGDRAVGLTFKLAVTCGAWALDHELTIEIAKGQNTQVASEPVRVKGVLDLLSEPQKRGILEVVRDKAQESLDDAEHPVSPLKRRKLQASVDAINHQLAGPAAVAYRSLSAATVPHPTCDDVLRDLQDNMGGVMDFDALRARI